jgi:hypothetical protein
LLEQFIAGDVSAGVIHYLVVIQVQVAQGMSIVFLGCFACFDKVRNEFGIMQAETDGVCLYFSDGV